MLFVASIENWKTWNNVPLKKTLALSIISSKCKSQDEKLFKEGGSIEMLKILGLIENIYTYYQNIVEENISQEFRFKNIDKTRHYFLEVLKHNELMSNKHKKV